MGPKSFDRSKTLHINHLHKTYGNLLNMETSTYMIGRSNDKILFPLMKGENYKITNNKRDMFNED